MTRTNGKKIQFWPSKASVRVDCVSCIEWLITPVHHAMVMCVVIFILCLSLIIRLYTSDWERIKQQMACRVQERQEGRSKRQEARGKRQDSYQRLLEDYYKPFSLSPLYLNSLFQPFFLPLLLLLFYFWWQKNRDMKDGFKPCCAQNYVWKAVITSTSSLALQGSFFAQKETLTVTLAVTGKRWTKQIHLSGHVACFFPLPLSASSLTAYFAVDDKSGQLFHQLVPPPPRLRYFFTFFLTLALEPLAKQSFSFDFKPQVKPKMARGEKERNRAREREREKEKARQNISDSSTHIHFCQLMHFALVSLFHLGEESGREKERKDQWRKHTRSTQEAGREWNQVCVSNGRRHH